MAELLGEDLKDIVEFERDFDEEKTALAVGLSVGIIADAAPLAPAVYKNGKFAVENMYNVAMATGLPPSEKPDPVSFGHGLEFFAAVPLVTSLAALSIYSLAKRQLHARRVRGFESDFNLLSSIEEFDKRDWQP
jgi:hypothetical protein